MPLHEALDVVDVLRATGRAVDCRPWIPRYLDKLEEAERLALPHNQF
jgi:hypothetical protein